MSNGTFIDNIFPIDATDIVTFMPLPSKMFGLVVLDDDSLSGDLYFFVPELYEQDGEAT